MWVIAKPFKIRKQYTGYDRGEDKKEATPVSYAAPPPGLDQTERKTH